jgi:hypothetical protein
LPGALDVQGGLLDVVAEREVVVTDLDHVALVEGDRASTSTPLTLTPL